MKNATVFSTLIAICLSILIMQHASASVLLKKNHGMGALSQVNQNSSDTLAKFENKTRTSQPAGYSALARFSWWYRHWVNAKQTISERRCFKIMLNNGDTLAAQTCKIDRDSIRFQLCESDDLSWHNFPLTAIKKVVGVHGKIVYGVDPRKFEYFSLLAFLCTILGLAMLISGGSLLYLLNGLMVLLASSGLGYFSLSRLSEHTERYKFKVLSLLLTISSLVAATGFFLWLIWSFLSYSGK